MNIVSEEAIKSIQVFIEREEFTLISKYLEILSELMEIPVQTLVDKKLIYVRTMEFSILAYSVWIGSAPSFDYILKELKASVNVMEINFKDYHISPIFLICERGFLDLLKSYLPLYMSRRISNLIDFSDSGTDEFCSRDFDNVTTQFTYNAVQIACDLGFIGIICYINEFFKETFPPKELDLHMIDEVSGENCALIAARTGKLALIKVLHERVKGDFTLINKKGQNVLGVVVEESLKNPSISYLPVFAYLVEVVGVNIEYNCFQILNSLKDFFIADYFIEKLKKEKIVVEEFTTSNSNYSFFLNSNAVPSMENNFLINDRISSILQESSDIIN